ncbi:hypothetical protein BVC93_05260 [Mycobacterium sp. MS1601]|nr:hypothetical protein BVC93_05260 [Mycobacterium sp. MS1601]
MTSTESATNRATARSWVTKISDIPRSFCNCRNNFRMPTWTVTSSAVVGSSAINTRGSSAIAIAMQIRWRMPPENWCG